MIRTYGTIRYSSAQWHIENAEPHVCIRLKNIFTKLSKSATNFIFPDTPETCHDLLWFMERYPLAVSDKDLQRLKKGKKQHITNINDLEQIMLPAYVPVQAVINNNEKARDYQLRGNQVYLKCGRLLIGDDIGLGKTLIAILSFLETKTLPAVVVVQTHLQTQWKQEIEWFTNLRVHCITKRTAYSLPPADVYVIKYSCLIGWVDVFRKGVHKSCVFDEVQELRRQESDKYKAATVKKNPY